MLLKTCNKVRLKMVVDNKKIWFYVFDHKTQIPKILKF